ncbi:MAG: hypothetical protein ABIU95_13010 [Burkholderiales bacterium]
MNSAASILTHSATRLLTALAASVMLAACSITQPAPIKQTFLLDPPASSSATSTAATTSLPGHPHLLRVNRFVVAQPFDGRALVYRIGDHRFETDFYNEFVAWPATMLTEGTMRHLAQAGVFRAAVPMNSSLDARYVLEGAVTTLHGDFRPNQPPAAVLAIRFLLARDDAATGLVYEKLIERRIELVSRSATALVAALDTANAAILAELARDLRALTLDK